MNNSVFHNDWGLLALFSADAACTKACNAGIMYLKEFQCLGISAIKSIDDAQSINMTKYTFIKKTIFHRKPLLGAGLELTARRKSSSPLINRRAVIIYHYAQCVQLFSIIQAVQTIQWTWFYALINHCGQLILIDEYTMQSNRILTMESLF